MAAEQSAPYRVWSASAGFRKDGTPIIGGTFASSWQRVVVMDASTFKRLIADHPTLATAVFEMGDV